jgi:hypothetical protein
VGLVVVRASWPGHPRKSKKYIYIIISPLNNKKNRTKPSHHLQPFLLFALNFFWGTEQNKTGIISKA